ncbi:glutathione S-transferase family protein [Duganella sp. BuS-21]|uniref:glutathione S-transferase family protein n=1 Tax=Duganella sp. BuS-21 TaxID=2943848 RepID=UPI0035A6709C
MDQQIIMYHFPGCPFSERIEILMALKGQSARLSMVDIDLSSPRPEWLLKKTRGGTALPAIDVPQGTIKDSMVIMRYLDSAFPARPVAHPTPYLHALEEMLAGLAPALSTAAYKMIQNRDPQLCAPLRCQVDIQFGAIDAFLRLYSSDGDLLLDHFGWAETILTPVFKRLWFLEYYENYAIPPQYERVIRWRAQCLAHPAAQAHDHKEIIKLYYDYSQGAGGGRLAPGRAVSSFTLSVDVGARPMPPRDKWLPTTDQSLGLVLG